MLIAILNFCVEFGIVRPIYWITNVSKIMFFPMPQASHAASGNICPFFLCSFFLLISITAEKHKSVWNSNTFWMHFSALWQLSLPAYSDIPLYQIKLKVLRHQHYSVLNRFRLRVWVSSLAGEYGNGAWQSHCSLPACMAASAAAGEWGAGSFPLPASELVAF